MEGRQPPGLTPEISALFSDALDDEGKPAGWGFSTLGQVTSYLNRGLSPKYVETGGVLVLNQKCIRNNTVDTAKARRHDHKLKVIDGRELQAGDILVTMNFAEFAAAVVGEVKDRTATDTSLFTIRPNPEVMLPHVLCAYLKLPHVYRTLSQNCCAGSGTWHRADLHKVREFAVPVPPMERQKPLEEFLVLTARLQVLTRKKIETLGELGSAVLSEEMKGNPVLKLDAVTAAIAGSN